MKRWKKAGLGVALVLAAAVTGLGVWQRENVKALYTYLTRDSESISQTLQDKQQAQQETLQKDYNVTVLAPSIDVSNDLLDGKVSPEEVKQALGITQAAETSQAAPEQNQTPQTVPEQSQTQQAAPVQPEQSQQPAQTPEAAAPEQTPTPEQTEAERKKKIEDLVNQCVAELYACEVDLMAQLGQMKKAAVDQWVALKPEERTTAKKQEIGFSGLEECYKLEVVIDDKVDAILKRYEAPIKELGGDTAVLNELWRYYCDKKADQKAYYLDKYLD